MQVGAGPPVASSQNLYIIYYFFLTFPYDRLRSTHSEEHFQILRLGLGNMLASVLSFAPEQATAVADYCHEHSDGTNAQTPHFTHCDTSVANIQGRQTFQSISRIYGSGLAGVSKMRIGCLRCFRVSG